MNHTLLSTAGVGPGGLRRFAYLFLKLRRAAWPWGVALALLMAPRTTLRAQEQPAASPLSISGYLETYYAYDFDNPDSHNRPGFFYSHNRHNEVALNLGFIKAAYQQERVRANLALMTGTYANANLAAEPGVLKNIFEANAGVKLAANRDLWLDAGIFASHIGFESAIGANCWNLTRSILADNSPYYESGVRLAYTSAGGQWYVSGLLVNGWQQMQRSEGNQAPAFGHQITYTPSRRVLLNSSSYVGTAPMGVEVMRYFHNFYGQFQLSEQVDLIAGFDVGTQQAAPGSGTYHSWYAPVLIARYRATERLSLAARGEYYGDAQQVIVTTETPNGFRTWGVSANLDYQIVAGAVWRVEARGLRSRDNIFATADGSATSNFFTTTSLAISF